MGKINKNLFIRFSLKLFLFVSIFGFFGGMSSSMASSKDFITTIIEIGSSYLDKYYSMVHFNVGGNDFGGGIIWLPVSQSNLSEPVKITLSGGDEEDEVYCTSQIRGFYWNSQRGDNRIWPLDQMTHAWLTGNDTSNKYVGLVTSGGWYTSCSSTASGALALREGGDSLSEEGTLLTGNSYGIYGSIVHYYSGSSADPLYLIAGVPYNMADNKMDMDYGLTCSLQRLNNVYPFGYLYDDYGHIGFVGARIKENALLGDADHVAEFHDVFGDLLNKGKCVNDVFYYDGDDVVYIHGDLDLPITGEVITGFFDGDSPYHNIGDFFDFGDGTARTTIFSLGIKGIVGLSNELTEKQKEFFENNQLDSTLLVRTDSSIASIVNEVSKNTEKLCKGKWDTDPSSARTHLNSFSSRTLVCYSGVDDLNLTSSVGPSTIDKKTLVVKGGANVIIGIATNTMYNMQNADSKGINLFIDKGNLLINPLDGIGLGDRFIPSELPKFNSYGYLNSDPTSPGVQAIYLKGNFIVNGLVLGGVDGTDTIDNRLIIHGKLVSYNTMTLPSENRIKTIKSVLDMDDDEFGIYSGSVSLSKLFTWSCDAVQGKGTDGTRCAGEASSDDNQDSQIVDKAFSLIDTDIPNDILAGVNTKNHLNRVD